VSDNFLYFQFSTPPEHPRTVDVVTEASRWVESLDRARIGRFAVSRELLMLSYAENMLSSDKSSQREVLAEIMSERGFLIRWGWGWDQSLHDMSASPFLTGKVPLGVQADAELQLWLEMEGKSVFTDPVTQHFLYREVFAFLTDLYSHPESLPYFEAGITDVELVDRCATEGIDVELAISMAGAR